MNQAQSAILDQVGNDLFDLISLIETTNFKRSDERKMFIDRIAAVKSQYLQLKGLMTGTSVPSVSIPAIRMYIKHPVNKKQFSGWIAKLHKNVDKLKHQESSDTLMSMLEHQNRLLDTTIKILNGDCFLTGIYHPTR
jgi:hypothetical protein